MKIIKELNDLSKEKNINVLVIDDLDYKPRDSLLTTFSPLIAYTKEQITEDLDKYKTNLG